MAPLKRPETTGTVLIIAMIIGAGMLVVAIEVSMFVASTIRQARAIDHTLVAQYAAESGVENALHQIRKEEGFTTRRALRTDSLTSSSSLYAIDTRDARWTFGAPDEDKFSSTVKKITKTELREQESLDINLWTQGAAGFSSPLADFKTMTVQWKKSECNSASSPSLEITALAFTLAGATVSWSDGDQTPNITKQFKSADASSQSITLELSSLLPQNEFLANKGMTLRVKPFLCSLRGVEIFFQKSDGTILSIPNYYLIRPRGTFGTASKDLQVIMPAKASATGIFDYLLFSEENIEKRDE